MGGRRGAGGGCGAPGGGGGSMFIQLYYMQHLHLLPFHILTHCHLIQGSNSVSWAASFMSTGQLQGEGQGEGRTQSWLLKDQSVGAYFIQKSAKLEELELPPSPEGQVRVWLWCGSSTRVIHTYTCMCALLPSDVWGGWRWQ